MISVTIKYYLKESNCNHEGVNFTDFLNLIAQIIIEKKKKNCEWSANNVKASTKKGRRKVNQVQK